MPGKAESDMQAHTRNALRTFYLPKYIVDAVLEGLPPQTTQATVRLLVRCVGIWQDQARRRLRTGNRRASPGPTKTETDLVEAWRLAGGEEAEIDTIRGMIVYRTVRHQLPRGWTQTLQAGEQLRSFWVTSGHDLADLDGFLADVDAEFPDMLPG